MKLGLRLYLVGIGNIATLALPAQSRAQTSDWLLTPTKVGSVILGMRVEDLYNAVGRDNVRLVDLYSEGMFTPALQVYAPFDAGTPLLVAELNQICGSYRIIRITAHSPRLRTRDDLGVGSTVAEVRRRHPDARLNREESPSLIIQSLKMTFAVADPSFADSARVVRVWTWSPLPDSIRRCPQSGNP